MNRVVTVHCWQPTGCHRMVVAFFRSNSTAVSIHQHAAHARCAALDRWKNLHSVTPCIARAGQCLATAH